MSSVPGKLFGTGGDEINLPCFETDTSVQDVLRARNQSILEAISHFVNETHKIVKQVGRIPVIWEDTVVGKEALPGLGKETIVTAWKGDSTFGNITREGYRVIQGSSEFSYMDWYVLYCTELKRQPINAYFLALAAVSEAGLVRVTR